MKKITAQLFVFFSFFVLFLAVPSSVFAATFSLSPTSGTYSKGSTLKVNVNVVTGGENVNAVQANITYPADKLQFSSVSTSGSALTIIAEKTGGGGVVRIGGGTPTPGFSGSKFIASVNFIVLADSGSATLSFAGDSAILKDADNSNIFTGGSTANLSLSGSGSEQSSSGSQTTQTSTGVAALTISNVQVTEITKTSAKVTWNTNLAASSIVEYGVTGNYEFNFLSEELTKDHVVILAEGTLIPGTTYYLRVKSIDSKENEAVGDATTFLTPGFSIKLKILDINGSPVEGASISLYSELKESVTDENGEATFENVAPGEHGLIVKYKGKTKITKINVVESDTLQTFEEQFSESTANIQNWMFYGGLAFGAVVILVLILILFLKLKKKKEERSNPSDPPTVVSQV